jgi:hypothetical protein
VLTVIADRLKSMEHAWVVTGSAGLTIHGLDASVRDIDLRTTEDGAYEIERRLLAGSANNESAGGRTAEEGESTGKKSAAKREAATSTAAATPVEAVRFLESPRIRSHFGAVTVHDFRVEIMGNMETLASNGEWEKSVDLDERRIWIEVEEARIPVLPLEQERTEYLKIGRVPTAELIDRWIAEHRAG